MVIRNVDKVKVHVDTGSVNIVKICRTTGSVDITKLPDLRNI